MHLRGRITHGDLTQELHPVSGDAVCVDGDQRSDNENLPSDMNRD